MGFSCEIHKCGGTQPDYCPLCNPTKKVKIMRTGAEIRKVANGYAVFELYGGSMSPELGKTHVFQRYDAMVEWLRGEFEESPSQTAPCHDGKCECNDCYSKKYLKEESLGRTVDIK